MTTVIIDPSSSLYGGLFCAALLFALIWVSVKSQDRWPFSCYPMFSIKMDDRHLSICRIALDQGDNGMSWWEPEFHRLPRAFDKAFRQIATPQQTDGDCNYLSPEQRSLFTLIASGLSAQERNNTNAIVLVRRQLHRDSCENHVLTETHTLRFPIDQIYKPQ